MILKLFCLCETGALNKKLLSNDWLYFCTKCGLFNINIVSEATSVAVVLSIPALLREKAGRMLLLAKESVST